MRKSFKPSFFINGQPGFSKVTVHYRTHIADQYGAMDFFHTTLPASRSVFRSLFPDWKILNAVGHGQISIF